MDALLLDFGTIKGVFNARFWRTKTAKRRTKLRKTKPLVGSCGIENIIDVL